MCACVCVCVHKHIQSCLFCRKAAAAEECLSDLGCHDSYENYRLTAGMLDGLGYLCANDTLSRRRGKRTCVLMWLVDHSVSDEQQSLIRFIDLCREDIDGCSRSIVLCV